MYVRYTFYIQSLGLGFHVLKVLEHKKKELEAQLRLKNEQLYRLQTLMRKLVWDMNAVSSCMGMRTEKQAPGN